MSSNPYQMSLEDLRAAADGQPLTTSPQLLRNDKGQFAAPDEPPPSINVGEEPPPESEAEPVVVEAEIDLEDGSGVQVFRGVGATEAEAQKALIDELTKAQANATKKIRELSAKPAPQAQPTAPTPEDELLFSQRLLDKPRATLEEVIDQAFQRRQEAARKAAEEKAAQNRVEDAQAKQFIAANPDYYVCETNGTRIDNLIRLEGLPRDASGIQQAYETLKAQGLLLPKPEETPAPRGRSSALSIRSGTVAPPPKAPGKADIDKMSTEELLEKAGGYQYTRY